VPRVSVSVSISVCGPMGHQISRMWLEGCAVYFPHLLPHLTVAQRRTVQHSILYCSYVVLHHTWRGQGNAKL
jgi:hypothetical protein